MAEDVSALEKKNDNRAVAWWILVGVGMIIVQVLLGGITRLTGSGLSITEWDVITGSLPPLSEKAWITEFEKYKQTPQFQLLNFDFNLSEFKFIYFWEWFHRFWARLIGIVFAIPFILFLVKKRIRPDMVKPLIILFLLGGLQGAVGWIMVASGLTGTAIYVAPVKLGLHFVLALGLLCYTAWFALQLLIPADRIIVNKKINGLVWSIVAILVIQLFYGALMAGHKAAPAAPTWPDINGDWIPAQVTNPAGGMASLVENRIMIHFVHRGLAYLLYGLILWLSFRIGKEIHTGEILHKIRLIPFTLVNIQLLLGIFSVLFSTGIRPGIWGSFEWMAQLHQLVAMLLLLSLVMTAYLVRRKA